VKDGVHESAQLELDLPADWQPVELKKAGMCSHLPSSKTRRAVVFCIHCSGAFIDCGRAASTELQYSILYMISEKGTRRHFTADAPTDLTKAM